MAGRDLALRARWEGVLECRSPLHVGGLEGGVVDLPLARDGLGRYHVPGSSLAGALRAWAATRAGWPTEAVTRLFGGSEGSDVGASRLLIEDAPVEGVPVVEVRDGVGIDRRRGTAAEMVKFDRMVFPRGTRLRLRLSLELPGGATDDLDRVRQLLGALAAGEVRIGAARSAGLGQVVLAEVRERLERLDSRSGLLRLLRGEGWTAPVLPSRSGSPDLSIEIDWEPDQPVMMASGLVGGSADVVPLTSGLGVRRPVLTGTALKGVLRSRAERIVRTLLGREAPGRLLEQVRVPLVEHLFGSDGVSARGPGTSGGEPEPPAGSGQGAADGDERLGRGAILVHECYAEVGIPAASWEAMLTADTPDQLREAMPAELRTTWAQAFHVGIDRWTGGAADQLLFSAVEPWDLSWDRLRIEVDRSRLPEEVRAPCLALLLLVVRDLALGRLPLGWATRRGYGAIVVREVRVATPAEEARAGRAEIGARGLAELLPVLRADRVAEGWSEWVKARRR
ncbi:MAG TPA: RAMP superfamily CRISPR-associated protein [Candidatus Dormibacteraeota bacterium]|nr:RAMP superfamily CRISPR-associated protein [Candidatus Dormibacteraeota bacterium]